MITKKAKVLFQNKVLAWYDKNKRDLPWRTTKDPYKILVSEIMLQQTQVDRVIPYYKRFLMSFSDINSLAKADNATLLEHWSGLGYNNRVLRLQKLAKEVVQKYDGKMPDDEEALLALPGIGPYTAHAVLAFAFNKKVPVMDTNIRRVLIDAFSLSKEISIKKLQVLALELVPLGKSCIWHNALMDYGAMERTARKTGIKSLSKQGKFEGSDRWIRGKIVKRLLAKKELLLLDLKKEFPKKQLKRVLTKMEKEKIIVVGKNIRFF